MSNPVLLTHVVFRSIESTLGGDRRASELAACLTQNSQRSCLFGVSPCCPEQCVSAFLGTGGDAEKRGTVSVYQLREEKGG